jgi:hypothetical protein
MSNEKISGNSAVMVQALLLFFFIPFILFVSYIIITKSLDATGICIIGVLLTVAFFAITGSLSYGDIYVDDNKIIVKKIIGSKVKNISEVRSFKKAIIPTIYYVEFTDDKKVYFTIKISDVFKQIFSIDSNHTLDFLNAKLHRIR